MGKVFVPSGPLIGVPFGSMFQLNPETETLELLSGCATPFAGSSVPALFIRC